ncbi:MAG: hypothetical protein LBE62_05265 [Azonexus sp.]|nr:hypothetical protein [Azonexus sp.]
MTPKGSDNRLTGRGHRPRHTERRGNERRQNQLLPYRVANDLVEPDRRSHLDRRAEWIRDYVVPEDDPKK